MAMVRRLQINPEPLKVVARRPGGPVEWQPPCSACGSNRAARTSVSRTKGGVVTLCDNDRQCERRCRELGY